MAPNKNKRICSNINPNPEDGQQVEADTQVLYQKLGDRWYVFANTAEGVNYAILPPGVDPQKTDCELFIVSSKNILKKAEVAVKKRPPSRRPYRKCFAEDAP